MRALYHWRIFIGIPEPTKNVVASRKAAGLWYSTLAFMLRRGRSRVFQGLWIASSLTFLATTGYAKVSFHIGPLMARNPFLEMT